MLWFGGREIEEWREIHRGFSTWREDGVGIQGEICST